MVAKPKKIMNLISISPKRFITFERLYRIFFYLACVLILITAVIRIGGALDKKIIIGELKVKLDHLLHALAYFVFSLYYITGRFLGLKLFRKRTHVFFFLILFLLGLLAEGLQIWVPYRSFSLVDLLSNVVGIGAGWGVTGWVLGKGNGGVRIER